jgi:hypothetical protein
MSTTEFTIPDGEVAAFCRKWKIREFALFGSALRDGLRPDSDVDVVVDFEPGVSRTLFDMASMGEELDRMFGRTVDVLTRQSIEQSRNYILRKEILSSMKVIYVS